MSVSQYKTYERCPKQYELERIDRVWQRPAAWLAQGTALHAAGEARERSGRTLTLDGMKDVYKRVYAEEISKYAETTPNLGWWFRSGPYDGAHDIERRFLLGLEQVERYWKWYEAHPEERIWVAPDGTPGIELLIDTDLGGIRIRGFVDLVIWDEKRQKLIVRDTKSGNLPGDDFQLGVYAVALRKQYGIDVKWGDFWMGKSGKATMPYDLSEWTEERVTEEFRWLAEGILKRDFPAKPEPSKCMFCPVSLSCEFSL